MKEKYEGCLEQAEQRGEFSPRGLSCMRHRNNHYKQYIVGSVEETFGQEIGGNNRSLNSNNNETWFHSPP